MQLAAYELYKTLAVHNDVTLIKWGGSNKLLPVVYVWLLIQALIAGLKKRPDVIYLQDGLMAPLGSILRLCLHRPTLITIHGKEATYGNPLYKVMVPPFVRRQDQLVTVSNDTKETVERAFPGTHPIVIFNGVSDGFYAPDRQGFIAEVASAAGLTIEQLRDHKLLYTNGRLVRRKGVLWFVNEVMPKLAAGSPVLYLVSGEGRDRQAIEAAIAERGLEGQVKLLGRVSDRLRQALYNVADIFLMPNVPVKNDMEGMGLVALEAASCGTTVVASDLEGIPDAIQNHKNGILVEPTNAEQYLDVIGRELKHPSLRPDAVRDYTLTHYSWRERAADYEAAMQALVRD
ncbi:MAG TPA: glycosyltransferase family 4 protein [Candidatus Saccharimonadales bacterium]|nr:glycosyltransferase family 4 protein [Candidatus Saccharimonadales bacterium]